jgi:hypothetical protein
MSDGRLGTDYRPKNDPYLAMLRMNNLSSSHQAREFLQQNADKLIELNSSFALRNASCKDSVDYIHPTPKTATNYCTVIQPDPFEWNTYWQEYNKTIGMR